MAETGFDCRFDQIRRCRGKIYASLSKQAVAGFTFRGKYDHYCGLAWELGCRGVLTRFAQFFVEVVDECGELRQAGAECGLVCS